MATASKVSAAFQRWIGQPRSGGGKSPVAVPVANNPLFNYCCEFDAIALMRSFEARELAPSPGHITNFLGLRVEPCVMPSVLSSMVGHVEGFPWPGNWHADIAEWAAALRSVELASETYRIVELGCGWGCWVSNMGIAARSRGLQVDLIGIEGDAGHLENARRTMVLNGFGEDEFRLVHGVAAPRAGTALFPMDGKPGEHWGHEPIFYPDEQTRQSLLRDGTHSELICYTLRDLAQDREIDLLHIDIQGAELVFVQENFEDISRLVKRVLIGTHSRWLEGALQEHFLSNGWAIEMDRPAICELISGQPEIRIDGVTSFRNPKLPVPTAVNW